VIVDMKGPEKGGYKNISDLRGVLLCTSFDKNEKNKFLRS